MASHDINVTRRRLLLGGAAAPLVCSVGMGSASAVTPWLLVAIPAAITGLVSLIGYQVGKSGSEADREIARARLALEAAWYRQQADAAAEARRQVAADRAFYASREFMSHVHLIQGDEARSRVVVEQLRYLLDLVRAGNAPLTQYVGRDQDNRHLFLEEGKTGVLRGSAKGVLTPTEAVETSRYAQAHELPSLAPNSRYSLEFSPRELGRLQELAQRRGASSNEIIVASREYTTGGEGRISPASRHIGITTASPSDSSGVGQIAHLYLMPYPSVG